MSAPLQEHNVLRVRDLKVRFGAREEAHEVLHGVSFVLDRGETLAIVGESGSGKSVTSLSVMRLVEFGGGTITSGEVLLRRRSGDVVDMARLDEERLHELRGADVAMIFQEPMTSLNPSFTVASQIGEALRLHQGLDAAAARAEARRLLDVVRIPDAVRILGRYPHQLSGGMRQRVMIAMALSCRPQVLIADEPTTALDVTTQAQILELVRELQVEMDMGVIFITHDMGVVAEVADRVTVMYHGHLVEEGDTTHIFHAPQNGYTRALLAAVPRLGAMKALDQPARFDLVSPRDVHASAKPPLPRPVTPTARYDQAPVLEVHGLTKRFDIATGFFGRVRQRVYAVEQVSFDLYAGETLALVGESGCGKSTTGRSLALLQAPDAGRIRFQGQDIAALSHSQLQELRRNIQFIFQDPFASLDPRMTVVRSITEPMAIHSVARGHVARKRAIDLMAKCGLSADMADRYPHEFSGGQRQRVCIARALALNPRVIIADESVSALDVSIQAQIVNLLLDLQHELGISILFISHDMAVVERVSHRVAVMYLGQIVEIGPRQSVFEDPEHPYTRKLMDAVPIADPSMRSRERSLAVDEIPSPIRSVDDPPLVAPLIKVDPHHFVARHHVGVY